jgi:hypothetical protein
MVPPEDPAQAAGDLLADYLKLDVYARPDVYVGPSDPATARQLQALVRRRPAEEPS